MACLGRFGRVAQTLSLDCLSAGVTRGVDQNGADLRDRYVDCAAVLVSPVKNSVSVHNVFRLCVSPKAYRGGNPVLTSATPDSVTRRGALAAGQQPRSACLRLYRSV